MNYQTALEITHAVAFPLGLIGGWWLHTLLRPRPKYRTRPTPQMHGRPGLAPVHEFCWTLGGSDVLDAHGHVSLLPENCDVEASIAERRRVEHKPYGARRV